MLQSLKKHFILAIVILGFLGCKKDKDNTPGTTINGTKFHPTEATASYSSYGRIVIILSDNSKTVRIEVTRTYGIFDVKTNSRLMTMSLSMDGVIYKAVSGNLDYKISGNTVSGKYTFTATSNNNTPMEVNNGLFENIMLEGINTPLFNPNLTYGTMTDQDGNVYKTITIGTQTWMAENLRTTKYNDGTAIPNITDNNVWNGLLYEATGAYCAYKNTINIDSISILGLLYNWYAVNTGKLAPAGWHVPSSNEWTTLINYLGGAEVAGGKMKETGNMHWGSSDTSIDNSSGFTALPSGNRMDYGLFRDMDTHSHYWSTTVESEYYVWYYDIGYSGTYIFRNSYWRNSGYAVRCLKD